MSITDDDQQEPGAPGDALDWHELGYTGELQQQTEWCWSAVAVSVGRFYRPANNIQQCELVNQQLGRADCCGTGGSGSGCNVPDMLGSSLHRVGGHWARWTLDKAAQPEEARAEIDAGRPLCVRIAWSQGGGHFLAISGYWAGSEVFPGGQWLQIQDPWRGSSTVSYDTLRRDYLGAGAWSDCHYTQS